MRSDFADRGTFGSGAMAGSLSGLFGQRANALQSGEAQLGQMDAQYRMNAIGNLLGLNQFGASQNLREAQGNVGTELNKWQILNQEKQFQQALSNQPSELMQFLGSMLGFGGGLASGGAFNGMFGNPFDARSAQMSF